MKLSLNFALLLAMVSATYAQDYELIKPGPPQFFKHPLSGNHKFALGIDSATVQGTDTLFYITNSITRPQTPIMPIALDSVSPSFLGPTIRKDSFLSVYLSGSNYYETYTVKICPRCTLNATWLAYEGHFGEHTGKVVDISPAQVLGQPDSIKTIVLTNGTRIKIAKHAGLVSTNLISDRFPQLDSPFVRVPDIPLLTYRQVYDMNVGDTFHWVKSYWFLNNDYSIDRVVSKTVSSDSDSVSYRVFSRKFNNQFAPIGTPDTITWNFPYQDQVLFNALPGEFTPNLTSDYDKGMNAYLMHDSLPIYFNGATRIAPLRYAIVDAVVGLGSRSDTYIEGCGHFYHIVPEEDPGSSTRLLYYHKGNSTGGIPLNVKSPQQPQAPYVHVYPNPAEQTVFLNSDSPLGRGELRNLHGQLISTWPTLPPQLSVAQLPPGVYWLHMEINQTWTVKKLIKH